MKIIQYNIHWGLSWRWSPDAPKCLSILVLDNHGKSRPLFFYTCCSVLLPRPQCEHCSISQPGRIHLHPPLSLKTIKSLTKPIQRTAVPMSRGNFSTWNQYCIFSVVFGSWQHWGLSNNLLIAMSWMSLSHGTHIWFMPSALSCAALTLWWWCNWHIILLTHTGAENKSRVCASPLGTVG